MLKIIKTTIDEHLQVISPLIQQETEIAYMGSKLAESLSNKNKILLCGNGGSASDCEHFAGELVGRFVSERHPLPAYSLTSNTTNITAISNDYGYNEVFARQVDAFGCQGDVLVAISTSGNSENVIRAVGRAKTLGLFTCGLLGKNGGAVGKMCDLSIIINSNSTARIQEGHILLIHLLCQLIEDKLGLFHK